MINNMEKAITIHSLHKTNNILKIMEQDSRINPTYIEYVNSIKNDLQSILDIKELLGMK